MADILKQSATRTASDWTPGMGCGTLDAGAALELATSRPASAWAETPNTDGAICSALGNAPATWPSEKNQTITFNALANKHVGDRDFKVKATSSSGLKVSFTRVRRLQHQGRDRASSGRRLVHDHRHAGRQRELQPRAEPVTQRFFVAKKALHKKHHV